ncbi:Chlorophyll a-b binding protein 6, chloroplastic [Galdieria sulphuraria]|uniref:Light-harvesting complex protein n=2 Tax=Galdieria sulphuraria TaxID=130081 RepID=M2VTV2_GALSU|nr:light-harvesting complex protein [Galdieria sulphuraria]EME26631.1 light-harvesting complex protein [Galdieria sulphuraria]GJD08729.1 Chlorophyll a-b binding protein 6, chloroplastic [Galdieria sulphuraria]|eukprot:XP_005703151.1 light-harvesting complex protein [Galdieria sulphuraria]
MLNAVYSAAFIPHHPSWKILKTTQGSLSRQSLCVPRLFQTLVSNASTKSLSVPFLERPKNLDGTAPGDVGFDPLYISDLLDIQWLRESEIKHGRICMLAAVGFIVQEFVHLPGEVFSNKVAIDALFQVPSGGLWQIFLFIGLLEFVMNKGKMTPLDMFSDPNRKPGDFGFDPLGLGKDPQARKRYEVAEIKNGRLAMLAVGGFIHHMLLTHQGVVEQLTHFRSLPVS